MFIGTSAVKTCVLKDGHVFSVHVLDPKVPGQEEEEEEEEEEADKTTMITKEEGEEGKEKAEMEKQEKDGEMMLILILKAQNLCLYQCLRYWGLNHLKSNLNDFSATKSRSSCTEIHISHVTFSRMYMYRMSFVQIKLLSDNVRV